MEKPNANHETTVSCSIAVAGSTVDAVTTDSNVVVWGLQWFEVFVQNSATKVCTKIDQQFKRLHFHNHSQQCLKKM